MKWFLSALLPFVVLASVVWVLPAAPETAVPAAPFSEGRNIGTLG